LIRGELCEIHMEKGYGSLCRKCNCRKWETRQAELRNGVRRARPWLRVVPPCD
jgi:hypothetical protein